jgi:endoglucanase
MVHRICMMIAVGLAGLWAGRPHCQGSAGFVHRQGEQIVDGQGKELLLRGMGIGGWMLQEPYMLQLSGVVANQTQLQHKLTELVGQQRVNAFYEAWRSSQFTKTDVDSMASWGFNCIRLPLHYNLFTLDASQESVPGQNTWLPTGFTLTDSVLSWCKQDHIYLILDLHAAPGGQGNDYSIADRDRTKPSLWQVPGDQDKVVALWRKLAERYQRETWMGGYDLLNETNWGFTDTADTHGCAEKVNAPLLALLKRCSDTIRSIDQQHLLFIEGNCWANNFNGMFPVWDSNMAVSFHKYWNYNDQGSLNGVLGIRAKYHVPLWLGESGENSNSWYTDAIALMEKNDIGWTWWPLKKGGVNNPLGFRLNPGFRKIAAYLQGRGPRPSADSAYEALMELASDANISRNIFHKDVVDAMFRQVYSVQTLPYAPVSVSNGTRLYADNYDLGRNGYAYYDLDSGNFRVSTGHETQGNKGWAYRNDGVDIMSCQDSLSNGFAVYSIESGEWMQYTIEVPRSGSYHIHYRIQSEKSDSSAQASWQLLDEGTVLDEGGVAPNGTLSASTHGGGPHLTDVTGDASGASVTDAGAYSWLTTGDHKVYLKAGTHHLRFLSVKGGFRLNYIEFE